MQGILFDIKEFAVHDGGGVRTTVFFKGCPMRCLYCHNPDTWSTEAGTLMESDEILNAIKRNQTFYTSGGITATGGEPLMKIEFLIELITKAKETGIHTCLDTSGILFNRENPKKLAQFDQLLSVTDLVLLDIKHINPDEHKKLTSHSNTNILDFARYLDEKQIPVWIRHVVVPEITYKKNFLIKLGEFLSTLHNVKAIEVLPYHTLGEYKWKELGIPYKLEGVEPPTKERIENAKKILEFSKY